MQSISSRIWTRVAVSISYDDNNYTTGTSNVYVSVDILMLLLELGEKETMKHPSLYQIVV